MFIHSDKILVKTKTNKNLVSQKLPKSAIPFFPVGLNQSAICQLGLTNLEQKILRLYHLTQAKLKLADLKYVTLETRDENL